MEHKEDFYVIQEEKPSWRKNKKIRWIAGIIVALVVVIMAIVIPVSLMKQQNQSKNSTATTTTTTTPIDINPNNNNKQNNPNYHPSSKPTNNNISNNNTNTNTNKNNTNINTNINANINTSTNTNTNTNNNSTTTKSNHKSKEVNTSDAYYSSFKNDDGIENGFTVSKYANLTRIQTKSESEVADKSRFFVIGDIHGCVQEFNDLIKQINFNPSTDQLILAGDMMSKGPDSNGVITRARELGAWCVRGNHDDKVVRFKNFEKQEGVSAMTEPKEVMPEGDVPDPLKFKNAHAALSRTITDENFEYISNCPSILRLPSLNNTVVVHGGLDPAIDDLVQQQPLNVMTMRHIDDDGNPTEKKKIGKPWAEIWNEVQKNNQNPMTVYYGHDASLGLNIKEFSFGVDTGCVYGRKLTAIEMRTKEISQVPCDVHAEDD